MQKLEKKKTIIILNLRTNMKKFLIVTAVLFSSEANCAISDAIEAARGAANATWNGANNCVEGVKQLPNRASGLFSRSKKAAQTPEELAANLLEALIKSCEQSSKKSNGAIDCVVLKALSANDFISKQEAAQEQTEAQAPNEEAKAEEAATETPAEATVEVTVVATAAPAEEGMAAAEEKSKENN